MGSVNYSGRRRSARATGALFRLVERGSKLRDAEDREPAGVRDGLRWNREQLLEFRELVISNGDDAVVWCDAREFERIDSGTRQYAIGRRVGAQRRREVERDRPDPFFDDDHTRG